MNRRGLLGFFAMALAPGQLLLGAPRDSFSARLVRVEFVRDPYSFALLVRALFDIGGSGVYTCGHAPIEAEATGPARDAVVHDLTVMAQRHFDDLRVSGPLGVRIKL